MNRNTSGRDTLLRKIQEVDFALYETTLYLDTHPDDEKALQLLHEYAESSKMLKQKYQSLFGPFTADANTENTWEWIHGPWPWEM